MAERSHSEEVRDEAALFALGALSSEEAKRFADRLAAGCPFCRSEVAECEQTLAAVALSAPLAEPAPDLRARLLDQAPIRQSEAVIVRAGETAWAPSPVPGVSVRSLYGEQTVLVRMAPKTWYPGHDHPKAEQCLVLEGSISSEGVTTSAGDYVYMPPGSTHQPLYTEEGCVLLIAYT